MQEKYLKTDLLKSIIFSVMAIGAIFVYKKWAGL